MPPPHSLHFLSNYQFVGYFLGALCAQPFEYIYFETKINLSIIA